ncbi:MAG: rRNA maturation RNase YbeY [Candidatus Moranbacteria bacterium]|nr:rRNA maturation RNase YbeY [Candidatus Moranbacteria bacterium]
MRVTLSQEKEVATPFDDDFLRHVAEVTLSKIDLLGLKDKEVQLGVAAVSEEKIQTLNKEYRGKDKETDILSFGEEVNFIETGRLPEGEELILGDLIYSPDFITRAALEDGISEEHEMVYIFSHGVLHLLGYDHSDEMFAIQDEVTEEIVKSI